MDVVADLGEATARIRAVFVFHEFFEAITPQYLILLMVALVLLCVRQTTTDCTVFRKQLNITRGRKVVLKKCERIG